MGKCRRCKSETDKLIVWCEKCWTEAVEKFAEDFCDNYCKYPIQCGSQDELEKHCAGCGLIELVNINNEGGGSDAFADEEAQYQRKEDEGNEI